MTVATSPHGVGARATSRGRVRTMRMQRHLAVAGLACVAGVVVRPTVHSLVGLLILVALIGSILGSLARAVDARLGAGWGWLYGEPVYSTRFDLLVDGIFRHLTAVQTGQPSATGFAIDPAGYESRIRILPLESEQR